MVVLFLKSFGTRQRIAINVLLPLSSQDHRLLALHKLQRHKILHNVLEVVPRVELRELNVVLVVTLSLVVAANSFMIYGVDPRRRP